MSKTTLYECKRKTTSYERKRKKTNGPPTRTLKIYAQEYQEARKAIPQEHQRHKLATIPTTTPTTTSTTTPAMRTTPMCCLAQSVRKSLYFMPKSVFL